MYLKDDEAFKDAMAEMMKDDSFRETATRMMSEGGFHGMMNRILKQRRPGHTETGGTSPRTETPEREEA